MFPVCLGDVNEKGAQMSTIKSVARQFGRTGHWARAARQLARANDWTGGARKLARALGEAVFPPVCCLCGARGQAPCLDLCDVCTTFLPVIDGGPPLPGLRSPIGEATLVRTVSFFKYEYPIDELIRALKFRGERVYARVLGELMARACLAQGWELPAFIVPMPLHVSRLRERGFNQAHEIARYLGASLGIRVESHVLVRRVATREQSGLSLEARRRNVRGVFDVVRPLSQLPCRGRIVLLDDVVTTGSTAMAAVQALAQGGAAEVELWAVASVEKDF
jgi:ComF family protein